MRLRSPFAGVLVTAALALACSRAKVVVITEDPSPATTPSEDAPPPSDEALAAQAAVREAVRGYAKTLDARDPAAADWVVPATFDYYEDVRLAALRATRDQLERWDLMSVILILQVRLAINRAELDTLDGRALFERAVTLGFVGEDVQGVPLDEVWIDPSGLRAEIRVDEQPIVWLARPDDSESWRLDIPEMIRLLGPAVEAMVGARVIAEGKVFTALTLLQQSDAGGIDPAVLDGPLESDPDADGAESG